MDWEGTVSRPKIGHSAGKAGYDGQAIRDAQATPVSPKSAFLLLCEKRPATSTDTTSAGGLTDEYSGEADRDGSFAIVSCHRVRIPQG
jgi:hypothetical protein